MTETDVTPEALLNIVLVITLSLTVAFACLILKFITRIEKRILLGHDQLGKEEHAKLPIWTYFIGILIFIVSLFAVVVSFIVNGSVTHIVFKYFIFGNSTIILPFIIICKDYKLRMFTIKHIKKKLCLLK